MKALVCGLGSIGRRHAKNLRALGHDVVGFDPSPERREAFTGEVRGATTTASFEEGIRSGSRAAVIASPNAFHLEQSLACARAGLALFIEKPLASSTGGLDSLADEVARRGLTVLLGSNWKFHPGPMRLKALIDGGDIGRVLGVQAIGGQYLPDWHPWEDYRQMYSSKASLGGGVLLDSHDVDYLTWMAGPVRTVSCSAIRTGTLDIETSDLASLLLVFRSGAQGTVQLDYLQRPYARRVHVTGAAGTGIWDYPAGTVRHYDTERKAWTDERVPPEGYDINTMYVDEMRHFITCLETGEATVTPLAQATHVLRVLEAAQRSADAGGAPQEVA